jgi:hypothetical protein
MEALLLIAEQNWPDDVRPDQNDASCCKGAGRSRLPRRASNAPRLTGSFGDRLPDQPALAATCEYQGEGSNYRLTRQRCVISVHRLAGAIMARASTTTRAVFSRLANKNKVIDA